MSALSESLFLSKEGFLEKLSRGQGLSSIFGANWKKRKFRLVGQRLTYFQVNGSGEHVKKGELDVANVTVGSATDARNHNQANFWAFMIRTSDGDEMTMKASSQAEKDDWMVILQKASQSAMNAATKDDSNAAEAPVLMEDASISKQASRGMKVR